MLEVNDIKIGGGEVKSGDNIKMMNFGIDGTYTSNANHPSWGVLDFRGSVGSHSDLFKTGSELWGKIVAVVDTASGTGRMILEDEIASQELGLYDLDVDTITWVSGNTIDIVFNGTPDLSNVSVGETLRIDNATNSSNNGQHEITAVDDGADKISVLIPARSDATDDEASDSPATGETGSVTQFTNTTLQSVVSNEFKLNENTYYRLKLNKTSGSGSRIASLELIIFTK